MELVLKTEAKSKVTIIPNQFIDVYLTDANDAQIKVYLYLLRMLTSGMDTTVSMVADKFNFTEKDIVRALEYWQGKSLIVLEYDRANQITGVCFKEMQGSDSVQEMKAESETTIVHRDKQEPSKISYTPEQLKELAKRDDIAQAVYITETYLGRPLSFDELSTLLYFKEELRFSDDLLDYLLEYCISMDKTSFAYMEKVAENWYKNQIETPEQAKAAALSYRNDTAAIMKALGKSSLPAPKEAELIQVWREEYGFDTEIIVEACNRSVLATDNNRFSYVNGILKSWKEADVKSLEDISVLDAKKKHKTPDSPKTGNPGPKAGNPFNQFPQNSYDFEALEKELQDS